MGTFVKCKIYYYRGYIPKKYIAFVGKAVYTKSLSTKSKKIAIKKAKVLDIQFNNFIIELGMKIDEVLKQLDKLIDKNFKGREDFLKKMSFAKIKDLKEKGEFADNIDMFQHILEKADYKTLATVVANPFADFISTNVNQLEHDEYNKANAYLANKLLEQEILVRDRLLNGCYSNGNTSGTVPTHIPIISTQPQKTAHTLKRSFEQYMNEKQIEMEWKADNISKVNIAKKSLIYEFGDSTDLSTITRADLILYRNKLSKLPKKWSDETNDKFNKCKTLDGVNKANQKHKVPVISSGTVAKYLTVVRSFFDYCKNNGYIDKNPSADVRVIVKKGTRRGDERKPYSMEDIEKIFSAPAFTKDLYKHLETKIDKILIPIIALYSGMRLNEIASLYEDDIKLENGIYYFDINDDKDKLVKNGSSIRQVPIHQKLIDLGLLEYFKTYSKGEKLWPNLQKQLVSDDSDDGRYSKQVSDWYQRLHRKYIGDKDKSFHSFRHNTVDNLKQQEVEVNIVSQLVGHTDGGMTYGRYAQGYNLSKINDVLQQVKYDSPSLDTVCKKIADKLIT